MRDNLPGVGWVGGDVLAYLRNWMLWTLAEHADEGAAKTRPRPTFVASHHRRRRCPGLPKEKHNPGGRSFLYVFINVLYKYYIFN